MNGATYVVDISAIAAGQKSKARALTRQAPRRAGIDGHPWEPVAWAESLNQKEFKQKSGEFSVGQSFHRCRDVGIFKGVIDAAYTD